MEIKRSEIDEVLEILAEAKHSSVANIAEPDKFMEHVTIVYPEEKRIYARLLEYLQTMRLYASP